MILPANPKSTVWQQCLSTHHSSGVQPPLSLHPQVRPASKPSPPFRGRSGTSYSHIRQGVYRCPGGLRWWSPFIPLFLCRVCRRPDDRTRTSSMYFYLGPLRPQRAHSNLEARPDGRSGSAAPASAPLPLYLFRKLSLSCRKESLRVQERVRRQEAAGVTLRRTGRHPSERVCNWLRSG